MLTFRRISYITKAAALTALLTVPAAAWCQTDDDEPISGSERYEEGQGHDYTDLELVELFNAWQEAVSSEPAYEADTPEDAFCDSLLTETKNMLALKEEALEKLRQKNGRVVKHTVERGEDIETIAAIYGTKADDIMSLNPMCAAIYAGMEIDVPVTMSDKDLAEHRLKQENSLYAMAAQLADKGDYSGAEDAYDRIIATQNATASAYFNRGNLLYRRGKYARAMSDMEQVMLKDDDGRYPEAVKIYDDAQQKYQEQQAARSEAIGQLVLFGAQLAGNIIAEKQRQKEAKASAASARSTGSGTAGGRDYDDSEASVSASTSKGKECRITSVHDVRHCNGSGRCYKCNGDGSYFDNTLGKAKTVECGNCGGSGVCPSCNGTGKL